MNKAVTEGLLLSPPDFVDGLDVWSSENGTIGTVTYDTNTAGSLVASDPDFGDCLELVTVESPQNLRHMGETPILPGCYLEVTARVKLISGPIPDVRVSAYPGDANGNRVNGVTFNGPRLTLADYGRVYTVKAIIGSGPRTGVDLVWGTSAVFGHIGIDVVGSTGAVVRVESVQVTDQTAFFHRDMMDWVDVKDYGAVGDGVTDDATAFETADADANGREVLVPEGSYFLDRDVTMLSPVRFEGTIVQPADKFFVLRSNFDYPSYADAMGNETAGLEKALQALINFADHDTLDLRGRRIDLERPIDVAAVTPNISTLRSRRVIRNGHIRASAGAVWDPDVVTSTANYPGDNTRLLTNVANIGTIAVGSLVEGPGVGREIYVREKDDAAGEITLSQPLYGAAVSQTYTFTRNKYMLDFSGFELFSQLMIDGIQFEGSSVANGILLSPEGFWWTIRSCWFRSTGVRGITSPGQGCVGITIEQNEFISSDGSLSPPDRATIGFNTNANDVKIRDNRAIELRTFGVIGGNGTLFSGNHFWQIDPTGAEERTVGVVFTDRKAKACIVGNYIDNQFIEFTNEYRYDAGSSDGLSFGRVTITGNTFTASNVQDWFEFIVYAPIGTNHFIDGLSVTNNVFLIFSGSVIDRVEGVNTALGTMNPANFTDLVFDGNSYESVTARTQSPALIERTVTTAQTSWSVDTNDVLPFGGYAMGVNGVVPHGAITNTSSQQVFTMPWVNTRQGAAQDQVSLNWSQSVRGTVQCLVRVDKPA